MGGAAGQVQILHGLGADAVMRAEALQEGLERRSSSGASFFV